MNVGFTADTHFYHTKILQYCNRPFSTIQEMNEKIVENWNTMVKHNDQVYHLGDFGYEKLDELKKMRYKLKGKIYIILGNHDYQNKLYRLKDCFSDMWDLKTISVNKQKIILSHYSMNVWDRSHFNSWNLYGHSHGRSQAPGKSMDVGVDTNFYKLWNYDELIKIMDQKGNNVNYNSRSNDDDC